MKNKLEKTPVPPTPAYWRTQEAAARWRIHPETVRRKIREGKIASIVLGRRKLIPNEEVERIEQEGRAL